jgi:hypothetical protein
LSWERTYDTKYIKMDWDEVFKPTMTHTWLDEKRRKATLESRREAARQALIRQHLSPAIQAMGMHQIGNCKDLKELESVCVSYLIAFKTEGDMTTRNEELAKLRAEVTKLNKKIESLEHGRMGKEPANGAVFKIEKRFEKNGKGYGYAAIKADGKWYLTGTGWDGTKSYDWDGLKKFIGEHSRVWVMTAREELVD